MTELPSNAWLEPSVVLMESLCCWKLRSRHWCWPKLEVSKFGSKRQHRRMAVRITLSQYHPMPMLIKSNISCALEYWSFRFGLVLRNSSSLAVNGDVWFLSFPEFCLHGLWPFVYGPYFKAVEIIHPTKYIMLAVLCSNCRCVCITSWWWGARKHKWLRWLRWCCLSPGLGAFWVVAMKICC